MEDLDPAAMAHRDHSAVRAAGQVHIGFDIDPHGALIQGRHTEEVHALDAEQFICPRTPAVRGGSERRRTRTVSHARPSLGQVAWSLLILEGLVLYPALA
ncbi:hypothetical protein, partial [Nocardioides malaquae]|uniref:hypothetical protein n=1 Tax=Nocardioides malaquae TaxID=2773426 RepID=UPI001879A1BF